MDVQHPGELVGEKPCAREHALVEECWEPFALHRVYYCYRRRTCVATCEDTLIERAAHRDQDAFARIASEAGVPSTQTMLRYSLNPRIHEPAVRGLWLGRRVDARRVGGSK